jgi:hypothetical protein
LALYGPAESDANRIMNREGGEKRDIDDGCVERVIDGVARKV